MAQGPTDNFRVDAGFHQKCCCRMPHVVRPDVGQFCSVLFIGGDIFILVDFFIVCRYCFFEGIVQIVRVMRPTVWPAPDKPGIFIGNIKIAFIGFLPFKLSPKRLHNHCRQRNVAGAFFGFYWPRASTVLFLLLSAPRPYNLAFFFQSFCLFLFHSVQAVPDPRIVIVGEHIRPAEPANFSASQAA